MSKTKVRPNIFGNGARTTPVEIKEPRYETNAELKSRLLREDQAERDARDPEKVRQKLIEHSRRETGKVLAALTADSSEFWSQQPISAVVKGAKSARATDVTFDVPTTQEEYTEADAQAAFCEWHDSAKVHFSQEGGQRLALFGIAQARAGRDMSNAAAWGAAFVHLRDVLKAFRDGEIINDPTYREPAPPAPEPAQVTEQEQAFNDWCESIAPLHRAWMQSLEEKFGKVPSQDDLRFLYGTSTTSRDPSTRGWFWHNNLSPLGPRSYDAYRKFCVLTHRPGWTWNHLDEDEKLAIELENSDLSRVQLARKQRARGIA